MRFRVVVDAHVVRGPNVSYEVPARDQVVGERSKADARKLVLGWAHTDAGVPCWRPYMAQSWPHTRAELYVASKEELMREKAKRRCGGLEPG